MVVRPVPRAGTSHSAHSGGAQRRLLGVVVAGPRHLRPDDGAARQRTRRPHAVRRKRRSCRSHQSGRGGGAEVLPAAEPGRRRAGAQQLLLDQPAQRRFLFDRDARRSPHLGEAAGVRPLHAQRSARVAQRLLRRGERRRPDRQFPVPQERRRHLRPCLHDEPERASRRARRLAALPGTERPAARRDFRSGVARVPVKRHVALRRREVFSALRFRSVHRHRRSDRGNDRPQHLLVPADADAHRRQSLDSDGIRPADVQGIRIGGRRTGG